MRAGAYLSLSAFALLACTNLLGIDGRYVEQEVTESGGASSLGSGGTLEAGFGGDPATGGSESGGVPGAGGRNGAGGIISAGGTTGGFGGTHVAGGAPSDTGGSDNSGGSADADAPCGAGEKRCPSVGCVMPDPSVGCELGTPCAACDTSQYPQNSHPICAGSQCDYECYPQFKKNTTTGECDPVTSGSGGSAGAGGAGGSGGGPLGSKCTTQTPLSRSAECRTCGVFPGCCNGFNRCGCLYVAACI
jgi:hypothetical protein